MHLSPRPCPHPDLLDNPQLHSSHLMRRILATRGVTHQEQLQFSLRQLHPVTALQGVQAAADLLADAIEAQRKILIVGDYDADGATATAVTVRALHMMGHTAVDC